MKLLDLPDGIRSTVYATIVTYLKQDPGLKALIQPTSWRTYTEDTADDAPPSSDSLPSIEILPYALGGNLASLITQDSPMSLAINVATEGLDVRDLMNLWEAVEAALFPGDATGTLLAAINTALQALPRSGFKGQVSTVSLTAPAIKPTEAGLNEQQMIASGAITLKMRVPH